MLSPCISPCCSGCFLQKNSPGILSPRCHNNLTQHAIKVTYGFLPCLEKRRVLSKGCCYLISSVFVVLLCICRDKVVPLHVFVYFSLLALCEMKDAVQYRRSLWRAYQTLRVFVFTVETAGRKLQLFYLMDYARVPPRTRSHTLEPELDRCCYI